MDFNTILERFGLDKDDFVNKLLEPIPIFNGYIYEVDQKDSCRKCPSCHSLNVYIKDHYFTETKSTQSDYITEILRIKKIRYKCNNCGKTFTPSIRGIDSNCRKTQQIEQFMMNDFTRPFTFESIGQKYGLSTARIIQIFDEKIRVVPRLKLPKVLCIDEIRFSSGIGIKYCCVLYDFFERKVVDIIKSRQLPYLNEYFDNIPIKERENVDYFISDMYDGYATIRSKYFSKAIHIVDKFHVVNQLTNAVNMLRVRTMNGYTYHGDIYYNFMKSKWKYFLCRNEYVPDRFLVSRKTGECYHYDQMLYSCIKLNDDFWLSYLSLQDLVHHSYSSTFDESLNFVEFLSKKLRSSSNEILCKVADTYWKWRVEIANAYTRQSKEINFTNSIAESINNKLKTIIKSAYGYRNFERFRKRALLICSYSIFD